MRPLGSGRADRDEAAWQGVAIGVAAVGLLLGRRRVDRQPDLGAELAPVAPGRALMTTGGEQDGAGLGKGGERGLSKAAPGR